MARSKARCLGGLAAAGITLATLVPPASALPNDPLADRQWGLAAIGAERAWGTGRGAGTVIAVVDTGVHLDHPDLRDKLVPGIDLVDDDGRPQDEQGHGTHVAGIAAASTGNGVGVAGVAPDARIMPVRVLDADGSGTGADVAAGIRWAADRGATVINLSLGSDTQAVFGPSFSEAVRYAWSKGSIPVVAAGNQFLTGSGFADEPAIVVTATSRQDTKAYFSSTTGSARWAMSAPGGAQSLMAGPEEDILSTYHKPSRPADEYAYLAGTSMAAPQVAGAAAVLRGLGLSPQETVDRLLATAKDLGPQGRDTTFGSGRLDLAAATGAPSTPTTAAPPPTAAPTPADPPPSGGTAQPAPEPQPQPVTPQPSAGGGEGGPTTSATGSPGTVAPGPDIATADGEPIDGAAAPIPTSAVPVPAPVPGDAVALTSGGDLSADDPGGARWPVVLVAGLLAAGSGAAGIVVHRRGIAAR